MITGYTSLFGCTLAKSCQPSMPGRVIHMLTPPSPPMEMRMRTSMRRRRRTRTRMRGGVRWMWISRGRGRWGRRMAISTRPRSSLLVPSPEEAAGKSKSMLLPDCPPFVRLSWPRTSPMRTRKQSALGFGGPPPPCRHCPLPPLHSFPPSSHFPPSCLSTSTK